MIVNQRIKELREKLNLSQEEFGKSIGLSKSGISNIEKGIRGVRSSYIDLICSVYNVSKIWLTTDTESELAEEVNRIDTFCNYLKSLGYYVKIDQVSETDYECTIKKDGVEICLTKPEFEDLQCKSKEQIEGAILLQQQKKGKK